MLRCLLASLLLAAAAGCAPSTSHVRGDASAGPGTRTESAPHAWMFRCATDCLGCTAAQRAEYERAKANCPMSPEPAR